MSLKHETGNAALDALRNFVRYNTHGGYVWAAVTIDGELLCETCVLSDYREHYRSTRDNRYDDYNIVGVDNSGAHDPESGIAYCAGCNKPLFGEQS